MKPAVIIPVYTHSLQIAEFIQNILLCGWPVFVVDDGSTNSSEIVKSMNGICFVRHEKHQNMGQRVSHFRPWRDFLKNPSTFSRRLWDCLLSRLQI